MEQTVTSGLASANLKSPIGDLRLAATEEGLIAVVFPIETKRTYANARGSVPARMHLDAATEALKEYFAGKRTEFKDLTLAPAGTAFQLSVWQALLQIPFGATRSYADIARAIGNPKGVRAVGLANGRNPIPVIVPCHRVIGSNGSLTGFGGGLPTKKWLLAHEGVSTPALL
ncbi:MAG: methylated-DNA--[protein]-cysteine S-methyltransferase [Parvibaculum sp.]|uniref:methylated-DNA--[protein]-cysteine S-methyltransferase n=1 Tax=Parvibaculum sp. TaxID=2024848 RepID=UPI003C790BC5